MIDQNDIQGIRIPTEDNPLRILMSSCLVGTLCGYDGTNNGEYPSARKFLDYKTVKLTTFCPEEFSYGTPRELSDIHGGNGFDVLDGKAKVLSESGKDWTNGMINASEQMLKVALNAQIEVAILMDISAACGSQVIYQGSRLGKDKVYQKGPGVSAALLMRNQIQIISQRDFASLEILYAKMDPSHSINPSAIDHHKTAWYVDYFK